MRIHGTAKIVFVEGAPRPVSATGVRAEVRTDVMESMTHDTEIALGIE